MKVGADFRYGLPCLLASLCCSGNTATLTWMQMLIQLCLKTREHVREYNLVSTFRNSKAYIDYDKAGIFILNVGGKKDL